MLKINFNNRHENCVIICEYKSNTGNSDKVEYHVHICVIRIRCRSFK